MNIDKFKQQHVDILEGIASLRKLALAGVARNAAEIAQGIVAMSATIKLHLAVEDRALYPAVARSADADLARKGREFQEEMDAIAAAYEGFAKRWNNAPAAWNWTSGVFATTPTPCCAVCTSACSAKTAISIPASRRCSARSARRFRRGGAHGAQPAPIRTQTE